MYYNMSLLNLFIIAMFISVICDILLYRKFLRKLRKCTEDYRNLVIKCNELRTLIDKNQIEEKRQIISLQEKINSFLVIKSKSIENE